MHDYFSIEYRNLTASGYEWRRGILQQVEKPPSYTNWSTCWQLLNETGDTQVELMGGEGGSGSVLDSFEDGDYRVPLDYRG